MRFFIVILFFININYLNAQIFFSSSFGIRGNFTQYQDINIEGYNDIHISYNTLIGFEVGYKLKDKPIFLSTGLTFGRFSEIFRFVNTITGDNYGVRDFGAIHLPYKVYEFPLKVGYPLYKFKNKIEIGAAHGFSTFFTTDNDIFSGKDGIIMVFSEEVDDFAKLEYIAVRIQYSEFGFSFNNKLFFTYPLSNRIKTSMEFQHAIGLTPGQGFVFFYDISNSRFRDIGEAFTLSKWDNFNLSFSIQYSL